MLPGGAGKRDGAPLTPPTSSRALFSANVLSENNGQFALRKRVPPGEYKVTASRQDPGNPFLALLFRLYHLLRPNTRAGSRKNIHAHYDLGNAFYGLWLDRTMTYSAGLFTEGHADTLEAAQEAKYERMLETLGVSADHHVLEIGCGWGGFAEYAARTRGCRVTGITISQAQLDYARNRIRVAGL